MTCGDHARNQTDERRAGGDPTCRGPDAARPFRPRDLGGLQAQFPELLQQPRRLRVHHAVRLRQLVRGLLAADLLHQQPGEPRSAQRVHAVPALVLHPGDHDEHLGRRAAGRGPTSCSSRCRRTTSTSSWASTWRRWGSTRSPWPSRCRRSSSSTWLGAPDLGVLFATYLGYWLMGVLLDRGRDGRLAAVVERDGGVHPGRALLRGPDLPGSDRLAPRADGCGA